MYRTMSVISLLFVLHASAFSSQLQADNPGTGTFPVVSPMRKISQSPEFASSCSRHYPFRYDPAKTRTEVSDQPESTNLKCPGGDYLVAAEPDLQTIPMAGSRDFIPESMSERRPIHCGRANAILTAIDIKCVPVKQDLSKGKSCGSCYQEADYNMQLTTPDQ